MVQYERFILNNGLKVILHPDSSTPLVTVNVLYDVGARDEDENKTGFAHLFEHLMFGGSVNIPSYDEPLQTVGGDNNAFTSNDITNYYCSLPAQNMETAFWLESDRMLSLAFNPESLDVQRNVVIEEFKQRYLNQPYGDLWLKLTPLCYKIHPYRWNTIGKDISHIKNASLDDVKNFFYKWYIPSNAILVVAGNFKAGSTLNLIKKWFETIPPGIKLERKLPIEPVQENPQFLEIENDVPLNMLVKSFHTVGRQNENYFSSDLLSDILGKGSSSRLFQELVKEKQIFNSIDSFCSGSMDPGLFIIEGKINPGIKMEDAETAVDEVIEKIVFEPVPEKELTKVKNKAIASLVFAEMNVLNKAMALAYAECLGDIERVNTEKELIQQVTSSQIHKFANELFRKENQSVIYYRMKKK